MDCDRPFELSFTVNLPRFFYCWFRLVIKIKLEVLIRRDPLFCQLDIKINLKVYSYSYYSVVNNMYQYFRLIFADFQRADRRAVIRSNLLYADPFRFNIFRQWILICACFRKSRRCVEINRPSVRFSFINVVYSLIIRLYCLPVRIYQVLFKSRSFISKTSCKDILLERLIFISLYYNIVFCSRKFVLFLCPVIRDLNIAAIRTVILINLFSGI